MALHIMDEANRCLQCKVPQCQKGCPIHTNIPLAIRLLKPCAVLSATMKISVRVTAYLAEKVRRFIFPALKIIFPQPMPTR